MPTLNPRTQVTLSPSLDLLVVRLAEMQRTSKSQVLRELLEAAEPALQRAVALMEAAAGATAAVHEGLALSLGKAQDSLEGRLARELSRMDGMTTDLVSQAQAIRARRPARGVSKAEPSPRAPASRGGRSTVGKQENPPASNRGVKSLKGRSGGRG